MRNRIVWGAQWLFISITLLVGVSACQDPFQPADLVTVQFNREHSVEFAGFYAAEVQGYYAEENLVVTLVSGQKDVKPVQAVMAGDAAFGIAASDEIVRARYAGQDVMAVSSVYRYNPTVIMALRDSFIREPKELIGKVVGVSSGDLDATGDIQLLGLLRTAEISPSRMSFVLSGPGNAGDILVTGQMDAMSGVFATQDPVWAREAGYTVTLLFPGDYEVLVYPNLIFTSEQLVDTEPDLVERFVRATLKGYQYALENPETAAALTLEYDELLDLDAQISSMHAQIPYIDTGVPLGRMDMHVWQSTQFVLLQQEWIADLVSLGDLYTNKFVPGVELSLNESR